MLLLLLGQLELAIAVLKQLCLQTSYMLIGTDIHKVLMFVWVLLFRKLIARTLIGIHIPRVLVIDEYLLPSLQYAVVLMYCVLSYGM